MKESNQKWHNDTIEQYQSIMFETLVYPNNITSESIKLFTFENNLGEELEPLRGYLASKEIKGKICKYFIDEEILEEMPIRVTQFEEVYLKDSATKKSVLMRPLNPIPFRIRAEKTFESTRQFIDEIAPFEHSNPNGWTLAKMIAVMGICGKTFIGFSSPSEFGKSGCFQIFHGLTQKSVVYQPRTEAGMLIQINEDGNMVFDEICDCEAKVKKIVGAFTLKVADNSPTYVNGAIKAKYLKQIYNITQQSVTFLYNIKSYYKNPDEDFFDSMFGNNPAIHSRMLKLKLDGKLLEHFGRNFDIRKTAEDNKMYYVKIDKHLLYLKELRITNAYQRKFSWESGNKPKGRRGLIYEEITWLIDQYCLNIDEYKKFIGVLDKAISDYKEMVGQIGEMAYVHEVINLINKDKQLQVTEEFIDTQGKFSAISNTNSEVKAPLSSLDFIQTFPKHECSIDDFLNKYPEEEMNLLLKNGDIYEIDNKTLKVLE